MATIWQGTHLALNRSIALKFIDIVGTDNQKIRERFLREARVAAAIRHRNVVDIQDFGTSLEGRPFMVMELLVGRTLAQRLDEGPMSVAETVRIVARVLSGLAAVHDAGIVHRDLKPENIFLVEDADGVYPKLLDFGVSRAVDPRSDLESVLPTIENAIVGTPQFMSPEQARGLPNIDHRSDLWSVGVILYELLTGVLPFDADAIGDVIIQIATAEPTAFGALRPDLAGPLERVIEKAMRRNLDERFQSAREMRTALLAAVARTAAEMTGGERVATVRPSTLSDVPSVGPNELLDALGDAYEPGDGDLLDIDVSFVLESRPPRGLAPPPVPREAVMTLDKPAIPPPPVPRDAVVTQDGPMRPPPVPREPAVAHASPRTEPTEPKVQRRWPWVLLALVVPAAAIAVLWLYLAPPAEPAVPTDVATIQVELRNVPAGAMIEVDGEPRELPIVLARSSQAHRIVVRDPEGRAFRVLHRANEDGVYEVTFDDEAQATESDEVEPNEPAADANEPESSSASGSDRRQRLRRARERRARQEREGELVRDPGF